jgi:hypothetical protein
LIDNPTEYHQQISPILRDICNDTLFRFDAYFSYFGKSTSIQSGGEKINDICETINSRLPIPL